MLVSSHKNLLKSLVLSCKLIVMIILIQLGRCRVGAMTSELTLSQRSCSSENRINWRETCNSDPDAIVAGPWLPQQIMAFP